MAVNLCIYIRSVAESSWTILRCGWVGWATGLLIAEYRRNVIVEARMLEQSSLFVKRILFFSISRICLDDYATFFLISSATKSQKKAWLSTTLFLRRYAACEPRGHCPARSETRFGIPCRFLGLRLLCLPLPCFRLVRYAKQASPSPTTTLSAIKPANTRGECPCRGMLWQRQRCLSPLE